MATGMGDGDRELVRRIESLERELEEQRTLLRYALRRFDTAGAGQGADEVRPESEAQQGPDTGKSRTAEKAAVPSSRWSTETQTAAEAGSSGREHRRETAGAGDVGAGASPLAELFRSRGWEWWLNKVGIGLLLFGVAFLFKFSVDQGWLSPTVRVGFGFAVGVCLLAVGLRLYEHRRAFSQVLLGGGIGTFYITGFAAYSLYALVPHALAFAFMVATTLLAFAISIRQSQPVLSMIGAAGGFGTPFLLHSEAGSAAELVLYAGLLLAGTVAIYCYRGWRSLLLASTGGMWLVLLAGYGNAGGYGVEIPETEALALQTGVIAAFLLPWLGSLGREILQRDGAESATPGKAHVHLLSVSSPLLSVAFIAAIWSLPADSVGWVAAAIAGIYSVAYAVLRRLREADFAYTHALTALLLGTLAVALLLDGHALFITLAVEAAVLHLVARRITDQIVAVKAHGIFAIVGLWLVGRLAFGAWDDAFNGPVDTAFLNARTLADLTAVSAAAASSFLFTSRRIAWIYRIAAHAGALALVWREFSLVPDGNAYVTLVWGAYAAVLVVVGLKMDRTLSRQLGLVTLLVVVGKLFLVDLVWVSALWRILLFLGFGGLFLVLSYYLQALWKPGSGVSDESN